MVNIEFLTIAVSIFALSINMIGLIIALIANAKFQGGLNKKVVNVVLILVVFLNIHIILNVYSNTTMFFRGGESLHVLFDHFGFILVIIVSIFTIVGSIVNYIMAKEQGFA